MSEHDKAHEAISKLIRSDKAWGIPWPCISEFLAVVTRPKYFKDPTPMPIALTQVALWVTVETCELLSHTKNHLATLTRVLTQTGWVGQKTHDASIASICIDRKITELWSVDESFADIPQLKVVNPLRE